MKRMDEDGVGRPRPLWRLRTSDIQLSSWHQGKALLSKVLAHDYVKVEGANIVPRDGIKFRPITSSDSICQNLAWPRKPSNCPES